MSHPAALPANRQIQGATMAAAKPDKTAINIDIAPKDYSQSRWVCCAIELAFRCRVIS